MMQDPTQPDLQPEEPICVCGYPKSGLPTIESPCPECGSTVLAVYKRSLSYIGWRLGVVAVLIALLHIPVAATFFSILEQVHKNPVIESIGRFLWTFGITAGSIFVAPWLVMAMPLGVLSLLYTIISMLKREPKRRSFRNLFVALFAILLNPVVYLFIWAAAQGA